MLKSLFARRGADDIEDTLRNAVALHEQGRFGEARELYGRVLSQAPRNFDALHLSGVASLQLGELERAQSLIQSALDVEPRSERARLHLGRVLVERGRADEALQQFSLVVTQHPRSVDGFLELGAVAFGLGRWQEALRAYDAAIAIDPARADAHRNRATTLQCLGRFDAAVDGYRAALELNPNDAETHSACGLALVATERFDLALAAFDRAIALRGENAVDLSRKGSALAQSGRSQEALDAFDRVLALAPEFAEAHCNRGNVLQALGRYADAVASYHEALALAPDVLETHFNLGVAANAMGQWGVALAAFDKVLSTQPNNLEALSGKGRALLDANRNTEAAAVFDAILALDPQYPNASAEALLARANACDWRDYESYRQRLIDGVRSGTAACNPFILTAFCDDPALQLECARHFWPQDATFDDSVPLPPPSADGRIRIAYLSANYHDHPAGYLIARLLELHDRSRFDITAVSFGPPSDDALRRRALGSVDRFIDIRGMTDERAVDALRRLNIDIAIDLMGFTKDERTGVIARRVAPIQVNYLGYAGTMGSTALDYIFANAFVIPEQERTYYAEKVVTLPTCHLSAGTLSVAPNVPARRDIGLPMDGYVYCCFNNPYKITPEQFRCWMRILHRVERGVLWLFSPDRDVEANLRREARSAGIDPSRIVIATKVPLPDFLARLQLADLFLDTLPYNAHSTASYALWAGLPVLTCPGRSLAARVAGSYLTALGLPELIANSESDYEERAVRLASDSCWHAELRERLVCNREASHFFDSQRACRNVERACEMVLERARRGERPDHLSVL